VNICHNVAAQGGRVAFFSTEMSREQVDMRSLSRVLYRTTGASAPSHRDMRAGDLKGAALAELRAAAQALPSTLLIDDSGGLSVAQIRARAREMRRRLGGLDLIAIDYLQILGSERGLWGARENRVQEVSAMTRELKALAKEEGVAILLLSQLNRAVESRDPPIPQLSDLRDSGSIEQDADAVWFVYRPAYYEERKEPDRTKAAADWRAWDTGMKDCANRMQVIVGKDRHGPIGTVTLFCALAHDCVADDEQERAA
jgi:replicative DNA helicase